MSEDRTESRRARAHALVADDALGPEDAQRRLVPRRLAGPRGDAGRPVARGVGACTVVSGHFSRVPADAPATIPLVTKHAFLSDDWFAIVEQLVEEHGTDVPGETSITMNLTVTDTPFGDERRMHMGAKDGRVHWGNHHVDDADLTLTTDYETAREVFITGDAQAGMQAFMAGKVRVQGDMAKLMAVQASGGGPGANGALAEAIQGITE